MSQMILDARQEKDTVLSLSYKTLTVDGSGGKMSDTIELLLHTIGAAVFLLEDETDDPDSYPDIKETVEFKNALRVELMTRGRTGITDINIEKFFIALGEVDDCPECYEYDQYAETIPILTEAERNDANMPRVITITRNDLQVNLTGADTPILVQLAIELVNELDTITPGNTAYVDGWRYLQYLENDLLTRIGFSNKVANAADYCAAVDGETYILGLSPIEVQEKETAFLSKLNGGGAYVQPYIESRLSVM